MKRGTLLLALLGILVLVLATGPDLWAAPGQSPERQTVPTRTPRPEPTDKPDKPDKPDEPAEPTEEPDEPDEPAEPTDEPPSSEPTSVPTTVPSAVETMVAGADGVNIRSGPGTNYARLGYVDPGAQAEVIGRYGDWWQIRYNDAPGWVFGELVTVSNADSVPQVESPAAPTTVVEATLVGAAAGPLLPESGGRSIRIHLGVAMIIIAGLLVMAAIRWRA